VVVDARVGSGAVDAGLELVAVDVRVGSGDGVVVALGGTVVHRFVKAVDSGVNGIDGAVDGKGVGSVVGAVLDVEDGRSEVVEAKGGDCAGRGGGLESAKPDNSAGGSGRLAGAVLSHSGGGDPLR
jgi:hypothetical protein